jgi:hypothetical protein
MLQYGVVANIVSEMTSKYACRFALPAEEIDTLMQNIKNFNAPPAPVEVASETDGEVK